MSALPAPPSVAATAQRGSVVETASILYSNHAGGYVRHDAACPTTAVHGLTERFFRRRRTAWVACGLGDNTIVVRDVEDGEVIGTMRGHGGAVHALLWSEAKGWLLSGAADATIRVWRVRNDTA